MRKNDNKKKMKNALETTSSLAEMCDNNITILNRTHR
jgi:hypothetical protein